MVKKFTKRWVALCLACMLAVGVFALPACGDKKLPDNSEHGVNITLVVLDLDGAKLYEKQALTYKPSLYETFNEFGELQVRVTTSFLGAWIQSVAVGEIIEDSNGFRDFSYFSENAKIEENFAESKYVAVYHDIDDVNLKDLYMPNLTYNGKEYYYSLVGVSLLPLLDGATYILKLAAY